MRVLVTGASGFLGSHVAERLARDGHALRLALRPSSSVRYLDAITAYERVDYELRDLDSLSAAVRGVDAVAHVGGVTSALSAAHYEAVNAIATGMLGRLAAEAGVRRFVYVSSLAAQGPSPDGRPLPPATRAPITHYGRSKAAGEVAVLAEKERMSVAIVRPPAVYGPRDRALLPLYRLALRGVLPVFGDGMNRVAFIHVYDAADAVVCAVCADGPSGSVYGISDGPSHTWREVVEAFARASGRSPRILTAPPVLFAAVGRAADLAAWVVRRPLPLSSEKVVNMRPRFWVSETETIRAELGWQPALDIGAGMAQALGWYRERGWL